LAEWMIAVVLSQIAQVAILQCVCQGIFSDIRILTNNGQAYNTAP